MHVAIGPQSTENAVRAAALRRMRSSKAQWIPDTKSCDSDLFIIGQFVHASDRRTRSRNTIY
jgi:hypothetical protein